MLATVLPVWLVSGWLVFHAYSVKRDQVADSMQDSARSLAMLVDRDLASVLAALQALATSPTFAAGDFTAVHGQVMELLKSYPGADIIVADQTGQQLVNSARPFGSPLPRRNNPETVRRIFADGQPLVSDLFFGAVTKRPLISIDVPVMRDGKVLYDLAMTFPSDRMGALLRQQPLAERWYSVIVDGKTLVVARSRFPERYVGKKANPVHLQSPALREGTGEYRNVEGVNVLVAFCRSSLSPWRVVVGVPKTVILSDVYLWTGWAVVAAGLISLFGVGLALSFARRIAGEIQSLVEPAQAIGRGEPVDSFGASAISEIGAVGGALVQASHLQQARSRELDRSLASLEKEVAQRKLVQEQLQSSEQRYRSLFDSIDEGYCVIEVLFDDHDKAVDYPPRAPAGKSPGADQFGADQPRLCLPHRTHAQGDRRDRRRRPRLSDRGPGTRRVQRAGTGVQRDVGETGCLLPRAAAGDRRARAGRGGASPEP
jgi:PAS domain-containing protein